ncbi:IS200/IS605 family transposase, partial [Salmonella enterica subsp. enterica serovar Rubislaw]|nr:IS200/IS605 family transposase [Salmonella enterica subsp. enterica serovar Rubislaw]
EYIKHQLEEDKTGSPFTGRK